MPKFCSDCKEYDLSYCNFYKCKVDKDDHCDNWSFKSVGLGGFGSQKMDLFKDRHEWKLTSLPNSTHKISLSLPILDYYKLGLMCISQGRSIKSFVQEAVYAKMKQKKKKESKEKYVQGSLF